MVPDRMMRRQLLATLAILAFGLVPDRIVGAGPARLRASVASGLFNRADAARIERGYYEQLLDAGQRFDDLGDLPALRGHRRPGGTFAAPVDSAPLVVRVDDLREVVLRPSDSTERGGVRWSTNAQGMRDREYAVDKPAGTFRIAMVGDSIAAGWGVNVDDRFESILEHAWDDRSRRAGGPAVEVIDCAVPGHAPGQRWHHFQRVGWPLRPDLVICEATEADGVWDERRLRYVLARGQGFDSPLYRPTLESAGVVPGWSPEQYKHALQPYHREILDGVYRAMAADANAKGVPIIWVLIPRVGQPAVPAKHDAMLASARAAGFARVVDGSDAYVGLDAARLAVEPDDFHPNVDGHARLAHRLDEALGAPARVAAALGRAPRSGRVRLRPSRRRSTCETPILEESRTDDPPLDLRRGGPRALLNPLLLLVAGLMTWPPEWAGVRRGRPACARPDRARPSARAAPVGYYVDLIEGSGGSGDAARPAGWIGFREAEVIRYLDNDFLLFELKPAVHRTLFGQPFRTNAYGMHDDAAAPEKSEGTFRIAVLGASMDMGWGVKYQDTYINRLEDWLNADASARAPGRPRATRCSTSPLPPIARSRGSRPCGAR